MQKSLLLATVAFTVAMSAITAKAHDWRLSLYEKIIVTHPEMLRNEDISAILSDYPDIDLGYDAQQLEKDKCISILGKFAKEEGVEYATEHPKAGQEAHLLAIGKERALKHGITGDYIGIYAKAFVNGVNNP
jgi:hypothetical protein